MLPIQEVMEKLNGVMDPELDQSLVELGFIDDVKIEGPEVNVRFRLPTYWCSPNFAYLMASDIREKVSELDWVNNVTVELKDHSFSREISQGVSNQETFQEAFSKLSGGDLEQLRRTFKIKAFYSRQEKVIRHLLSKGMTEQRLVSLTVSELEEILTGDMKGAMLKDRYLLILKELGLYKDKRQPAFIDEDGKTVEIGAFRDHLLKIRRTRLSMEFNAFYCRNLLLTRYNLQDAGSDQNESLEVKGV